MRLTVLICVALFTLSVRAEEVPPLAPADVPADEEFPQTAPLMTSEPPPPEGAVLVPSAEAPAPEPTEAAPVVVNEPEQQPEPQPEPEIASAPSETSAEFDPRIPRYTLERPQFGVEIMGSGKGLGSASSSELGASRVRALSIQMEYQPRFLQKVGVLGFGPSITFYPVTKVGGVTASNLARPVTGIWSVGGQVRYQLRLFREQLIVPSVGYSMESVGYRFKSGANGRFVAKGLFFGGMILLNFFEPGAAGEFYVNNSVLRTYLVAELRQVEGSDDTLGASGSSAYFGLRFEF